MTLATDFFARPAAVVAEALVGCALTHTVGDETLGGLIVETEAYDQSDPASHSFIGPTARNQVMFGPPGRLYVYRSYGIHWCTNISTGDEGHGAAVLIRAIEPVLGVETMLVHRKLESVRNLTRGPGRLSQALAITDAFQGHAVDSPPIRVFARKQGVAVQACRRVGISKGVETPWRFCKLGSRWLSRPICPA